MKSLFLAVVVVLSMGSSAFAEVVPTPIDWTHVNTAVSEVSARFPFSVLAFGAEKLNEAASISPTSPAGISVTIFQVTFEPLGFMGNSTIDVLFAAFRMCALGLVIFSLCRHVVEQLL